MVPETPPCGILASEAANDSPYSNARSACGVAFGSNCTGVSSDHAGLRATFAASNGDVIELDTRTGTHVIPHSRGTGLQDCGDKIQVCLIEQYGLTWDCVELERQILTIPRSQHGGTRYVFLNDAAVSALRVP